MEENPEHACAEVIYACLVHEYHAKEKNVDFDIDDIRFWQLEYILKNGFDAFTELANRIRQKLIDSIVPDSNN